MSRKNLTISVMVLVLCLASPQVMGLTQFLDGSTHNINYKINDDVWVDYQAPGMQTTINWLNGASTCAAVCHLAGFEDSRINIFGGSIGYALSAYDRSQVTMSGGSISSLVGGLVGAFDSSQVTISGGTLAFLLADDSGQVTIQGSDFAVDGKYFGYGKLTSTLGGPCSDEPYGRHLTGILPTGDMLDSDFKIGHDARIVLVPEPATLLLLGLGGLMLLRRPRK